MVLRHMKQGAVRASVNQKLRRYARILRELKKGPMNAVDISALTGNSFDTAWRDLRWLMDSSYALFQREEGRTIWIRRTLNRERLSGFLSEVRKSCKGDKVMKRSRGKATMGRPQRQEPIPGIHLYAPGGDVDAFRKVADVKVRRDDLVAALFGER